MLPSSDRGNGNHNEAKTNFACGFLEGQTLEGQTQIENADGQNVQPIETRPAQGIEECRIPKNSRVELA